MSLLQHTNTQVRFDQQVENSRNYVIPFIAETFPVKAGMRVIEIGCGEGGVLLPFLELGCRCVGVDLEPWRIAIANDFLRDYLPQQQVRLIAKNIYDLDFLGEFKNYFDLILLKDAIEHIPDQEKITGYMKALLRPGGQIYFGFPPWYMPHGGHQQICENKVASMLPYIHLLPNPLYKGLLKAFGEKPDTIQELMAVKSTGISIERFERILERQGYRISNKRFYLINPIYKYKFRLQPRKQLGVISALPYLRDFFTTCVYYLVGQVD